MTDYFKKSILNKRPEFLDRESDIIQWVKHPNFIRDQVDGRKRCYVFDVKMQKWIRIILLEDGKTVHNIFYDRSFKGKL